MPASLSFIPASSFRKYKLTALLLFFPLFFFGQTLTGLWTGALSNDSTTVRKDQLFEIALTEYRGKVYGYSRSEFIVNDTLYYIVKRVKGTIEGDVCEVTDDDIIAYNFRGKLDKGIKVTSTFRRNGNDSAWYLAGTWKTNATKKYYSVTGKVDLGQEKDLTASKIFPHLEELNVADDIAFYKERNETVPVAKIAKPEKIKTEYTFNNDQTQSLTVAAPDLQRVDPDPVMPDVKKPDNSLVRTGTKEVTTSKTSVTVVVPDLQRTEAGPILPDVKKPDNSLARTETKDIDAAPVTLKPSAHSKTAVAKTTSPVSTAPPKTAGASPVAKTNPAPATSNSGIKKPDSNPVAQKTISPAAAPAVTAPPKTVEELTKKVAVIEGRKSEFSQVVNFKSDSLLLSLYDNGEIDGDTVSVIMNGETIMAKQGLKGSAIKKTIYIKPGQEEDFTLVLFADNLGKYPPNTGLLVVHDGEDTYHLRFSSDFQKSSGIVFRRKK
ncbi:MAG: hypothetical protein ACT4OJ_03065 [Bacteroidota bacterium]